MSSRYLGLQFLDQGTADDFVDWFVDAMEDLNCWKLIQISMGEPRINWLSIEKLKHKSKCDPGDPLLGSCSVHIVHGAFKWVGKCVALIVTRYTSLYCVFNDSPARRDVYTKLTSSKKFPLKFPAHCWLERVVQVCGNTWKNTSLISRRKLLLE